MKQLPIQSPAYLQAEQEFKAWLSVLGYAETTVYGAPFYVRGFLHYLEQQGYKDLASIESGQMRQYYHHHLRYRSNVRRGGGLSSGSLNKHQQSLRKFCDYLRQSKGLHLAPLDLEYEERVQEKICVLSEEEVKQLYEACALYGGSSSRKPSWFYPAFCLRDRAMLAVYYGCGLRRKEGLYLDVEDILWEKQLLYVKKGKNQTERFVPLSKGSLHHLENYVKESRPLFLRAQREGALFISERGGRMSGQMMLLRLHSLLWRTENQELQQKKPGLHTLRHSIATHLLAKGMKIEKIKVFLGHKSIDSTQIYTHLTEQKS